MSNSRTKGNNTLRQRLTIFLDKIPSGEEIQTNHVVSELSKINRNYSICPQRVHNLLKECQGTVKFIKSGVWLKL
jgi:hypothetical protein